MFDIDIAKNLQNVQQRITAAAARCGRNPDEIRLVTVSKTIPADKIQQAIDAGATILGENYIQETRKKIEIIRRNISWHFIGHLQSNKAKYAVDLFNLIHSVDSTHVAEQLNKEAGKKNKVMPILIQVNISGEDTKHGINPQVTIKLIEVIAPLGNLRIKGLMTMPPWSPDPEESRPYFIALRKLKDELTSQRPENVELQELSMGMSADFEVAIEEGATLVRVGTAIFGPRK